MKRPRIRNLIHHDGLTQPGRHLAELDPQSARIDDRSTVDILAFLWRYSDHLRFFEAVATGQGEEVVENGSWQQLLRHEPLFVLAVISRASPVHYSTALEEALARLDRGHDPEWPDKILQAFEVVLSCCQEVARWSDWLPAGSGSTRDLKIYIGQMAGTVERLLALYRLRNGDDRLWQAVSSRLPGWQIDRYGAPAPGPGLLTDDQYLLALRNLFAELQTIYSAIVNHAKARIEVALTEDSHQAHVGLLLAFLRLLDYSRDHLNTLTGRHLDFYLKQVLRLTPRKRQPDMVNLTFELAGKVDRHLLAAKTAFKGGKNEDRLERLYDLKQETALNRGRVTALKNIHVRRTPVRRVHVGLQADSANGLGAPLAEDKPKWPGFGSPAYPLAELGFALASPLLRLSEGVREITLTFSLAEARDLGAIYARQFKAGGDLVELPALFSARVTTAKGWHPCRPRVRVNRRSPALVLDFTLAMEVPPLVDYDPDQLADSVPLPARWPVLHLTADQQAHPEAYEFLRRLKATELRVEIGVEKVRNLVLANDLAGLKPDKPFAPFGSQPVVGSSFFIGHGESFSKPLTQLSLSWQWVDPPGNLDVHYRNYTDREFQFQADVSLRENYGWDHVLAKGEPLSVVADPDSYKIIAGLQPTELREIQQAVQGMGDGPQRELKGGKKSDALFSGMQLQEEVKKALERRFELAGRNEGLKAAPGGAADLLAAAEGRTPQFTSSFTFAVSGYEPAQEAPPFAGFSETLRQGGIRFRLASPEFAFGHKLYPKLHSQAVAAAMNPSKPDPTLLASLQLPYTPMLEGVELAYRAEAKFSLKAPDPGLQLLLVTPFGYVDPLATARGGVALAVDFSEEGALFIGLADLAPPQNLSLLLQLAEGSGDPFLTTPQKIEWSFLGEAGWVPFTPAQILRDTTLGLLQSGIIDFALPGTMSQLRPEMDRGLYWLRVTASDHTAALHDLLAVIAQAGVAEYRDEGQRAGHLATALPAGSVTKLLVRDPKIKAITQPFASYGGREEEDEHQFRTRAGERLRHKDRAVSLWDYEHLILDRFPGLHKVKCLNHTCPESEFSPGHVMLVLIPDLRNRNSRYPLQPAVPQGLLEEVRQFLRQRCSAQVTVHVVNPRYERVAVGGVAHFHRGYDQGIYERQLHKDITDGLTPWLRGEKDLHFGGRIHGSVILNLIENLAYVDYLSSFSVTHYTGPDDLQGQQVEEVVATSGRSILVPHDRHSIQGLAGR